MTVPFVGANSAHYYVEELTPGVTPDNPEWKKIRFTSGFPALVKDQLLSEELDDSREIVSIRTGNEQINGEFAVELSQSSQDDLIANAMTSSWVAGFTTAGVEITVDDVAKTFTRTAGDFVAEGVEVGKLMYFPDLTGNNAKPFIATSVTTTVVTGNAISIPLTAETLTTDYTVADSIGTGSECKTISVLTWLKGKCGTVERFILTKGVEFSGFNYEIAVNANVTGSFPLIGRTQEVIPSLPAGSTFAPDLTTKQFTGVDGRILNNDEILAYTTSVTITNDNEASAQFALGDKAVSFIERGRASNTISASAFMEDVDLYNSFIVETELTLTTVVSGPDGAMSFTLPRTVLNAVTPEIGGPLSVTQTIEGQGLGNSDLSSLIIQRLPAA